MYCSKLLKDAVGGLNKEIANKLTDLHTSIQTDIDKLVIKRMNKGLLGEEGRAIKEDIDLLANARDRAENAAAYYKTVNDKDIKESIDDILKRYKPDLERKLKTEELVSLFDKPEVDFDEYIARNDLTDVIDSYTHDSSKINLNYLKGYRNKYLDKLFSVKGNYYGTTYRGTVINAKHLNQLKEGDIIANKMPLSSSKDANEASTWAHGVQRGHSRSGKPTIIELDNSYVPQYDIEKYSGLPEEKEVLIANDNYLHIQDIEKGDTNIIKVRVLPKEMVEMAKSIGSKAIKNIMSLTGGAILLDKSTKESKTK